ncbi:BTB/POZ domain-containing protein 7 [Bactrocera tryoni]|uniref:BTB/POZ domain-containing protein 7 n=1 Tax=Bactrocera tryoni TaxID=59916 RepID=UPI001A9958A7|nr:BTB/POZ domain-containing protein 7 [Bactrocera tryoni]
MGATASTSGYQMPATSSNAGGSSGLLLPSSAALTAGASGSGGGPGGNSLLMGAAGVGVPHFREQRRKRVTGFATLKRKFIRRRRSSKACDHARVLRDFVSDWTPLELAALCEEYEALAALRDLSVQAELARPPATTFKQDLAAIYEMKTCTDCDLVFRGSIFPVHRSILSSRCSYFRDLLAGCPGFGARICLELPTSPIDVQMFSSLLRFLYTGDLCPHDPTIDINLLRQLSDDFGTPNPLEHDLRYLLETGDYADAALVFTVEGNDYHRPDSGSSEYGFRPKLELPCHKAILSARSPFFRNLIARRTRNIDEYTERALHVPTRIVLDETVIPKRYARVLLHAIYLDTVDLTLILRGAGSGNSAGSLGEVHALTNTGRARPTPLEEAMELYQIGRFLELDILAQGCEDLILEWLTLDTLPTVLRWGSQPHGSAWVYRQACQYLREEFSAVIASPVLHQLDKSQLIHVLQSNFLQASELEVLQAVLKWGEQELIRRMEDREPNIVSHTAHSVTRKGVKKRDLSDVELREILSELLPLVRMDHVLPPNSEVLAQAIRRGLVSTPPSHMISDDRENLRVNAWIRGGKNQGLFVRPRLFMPYFEEVKVLLEDRMASSHHQAELMRMRRSRHLPDIPDTLYMVSRISAAKKPSVPTAAAVTGKESVNILAAAAAIPPPDTQTLAALLKREHKLHQSPMCQRALLLPLSSKHEIDRQIRLRVVREFNLPDAVSDLLETSLLSKQNAANAAAASAAATTVSEDTGITSTTQTDPTLIEDDDETPPPSPAAAGSVPRLTVAGGYLSTSVGSSAASSTCGGEGIQPCYSRNLTFPRQHPGGLLGMGSGVGMGMLTNVGVGGSGALQANYARLSASVHHRNDLPALITEGDYRFPHGSALGINIGAEGGGGAVGCGDGGNGGHLSDMMPDVAIATASLGQLHLANNSNNSNSGDMHESLQLDLGDGSSHIMGGGAPGAVVPMGLRGMQHQLPPSNYHHFMQRSNSPFDMLRQGQHSPAPHPPPGTYNSGPPRFL